jgi:hypothetical protein
MVFSSLSKKGRKIDLRSLERMACKHAGEGFFGCTMLFYMLTKNNQEQNSLKNDRK